MRLDLLDAVTLESFNNSFDAVLFEHLTPRVLFNVSHASLLQSRVFNLGANLVIGATRHVSFVMMETSMKAIYTAVILGASALLLMTVKSYHVHIDEEESDLASQDQHQAAPIPQNTVSQGNAEEANKGKETKKGKEETLHPFAFMALGRVKDHTVLAEFKVPGAEEKVIHEFEDNFQKLLKAAKLQRIKNGSKDVTKGHSCKIFYTVDQEGKFMATLAVVDKLYADKYAYSCLHEFMEKAHKMLHKHDADNCSKKGLDKVLNSTMNELFSKFKNPETHTVYGQTLNKMKMVEDEMTQNVAVVTETNASLAALEESTHNMDMLSKTFNKHADAAKWKHEVERYKMYITYGTIALDVLSLSLLWFVL